MSVDVCYLISHGFAARMILHSQLLPEMRKLGLNVAIVTPDADEPAMRELATRYDVQAIQSPPLNSTIERYFFNQMQRYFFEDIENNPALWAKHLRDTGNASSIREHVIPAGLLRVNRLARKYPALPKQLNAIQRRLLRNPAVAEILKGLQPKLVVSTYPVQIMEAAFLLEAEKQGILTVGHLLSWDNITCKGRFTVPTDSYISWGSIMSQEISEYYGVSEGWIRDCGVPHFDAHAEPIADQDLAAELTSLSLDPAKPYIFFGMSSPYFAPNEIDVVEWVARQICADSFGPNMQLVVRPHPQNVHGSMSDQSWLPRLEAIRGPRVGVDYPNLQKSRLAWNMSESDLPHLARLLRGCCMCLNSGSTLSIDAILHDRPVVLTPFDAETTHPWWRSARRVLEYQHLNKLIALNGVRVADSFDSLEMEMREYLAHPERDSTGRLRTREQECGPCDGRSAERVAAALAHFADEATHARKQVAL